MESGSSIKLFFSILLKIFKFKDIACMTHDKDYILGSVILSASILGPGILGGMFDSSHIPAFAFGFGSLWVLGNVIYSLLGLDDYAKTHHFKGVGTGKYILIPLTIFWGIGCFLSDNYVAGILFIIFNVACVFYRPTVLAANAMLHYFFLGLFCSFAIDAIDIPIADASIPEVDDSLLSDDIFPIDTDIDADAPNDGLENVDEHYRKGTWVDSYTKADGTVVEGHYRDGGMVSEHLKNK